MQAREAGRRTDANNADLASRVSMRSKNVLVAADETVIARRSRSVGLAAAKGPPKSVGARPPAEHAALREPCAWPGGYYRPTPRLIRVPTTREQSERSRYSRWLQHVRTVLPNEARSSLTAAHWRRQRDSCGRIPVRSPLARS